MTLKDAKSTIGSSLSVTTKGSSDDSATVTSTDPAAGSSVDKGSTITLTTSAPSATFDPNSVVGMSQSDATTELQSNGYTVKKNDSSSDDSATVTKVTVSNKQVTLYVDSN
jgi:serine/threonine-protein kinase